MTLDDVSIMLRLLRCLQERLTWSVGIMVMDHDCMLESLHLVTPSMIQKQTWLANQDKFHLIPLRIIGFCGYIVKIEWENLKPWTWTGFPSCSITEQVRKRSVISKLFFQPSSLKWFTKLNNWLCVWVLHPNNIHKIYCILYTSTKLCFGFSCFFHQSTTKWSNALHRFTPWLKVPLTTRCPGKMCWMNVGKYILMYDMGWRNQNYVSF